MTAIEVCLDVTAELSEQLARAVGFRNVLVHEYVTVDGTPVVRRLEDLSDLDRFVSAVIDWMPSRT